MAWAAGGGQVLRSDDGAKTWSVAEHASRLAFADRDQGWAIGPGFILHTTDGGRRWVDQTASVPLPVPVLVDVAAADPRHAIAAGSENPQGTLRNGPPEVLVTSDGGANWRRAQLTGVDPEQFEQVRLTSACLTTGTAGLTTGTDLADFMQTIVLVTRDAGESWENVTSRLPICLNATVGCAPGGQLWFLGGESTLFGSPDSGRTWEDRGSDLRPELVLQGITFLDESRGWVVAEDPFGSPVSPGGPGHAVIVLATDDGGGHWREHLVSMGHGELTLAIDFVDRFNGVVVAQDLRPFAFPRSSFGLSFVTTDGGETWTETVHPPPIDALWDVELFP